jgi:hypothetical protein
MESDQAAVCALAREKKLLLSLYVPDDAWDGVSEELVFGGMSVRGSRS